MNRLILTPQQKAILTRSLDRAIFLEGPAGSGKSTTGLHRILELLDAGVAAQSILFLTPQRTLAASTLDVLRDPGMPPGGQVQAVTVGGLARRMTDLFWPVVAEQAGFAQPDQPPSFLTLETALYYMAYLVRPLIEKGMFDSVTIDRNRIFSQIIDNLNKAAVVGFPHTEIGQRLREGWADSTRQANILEDAQYCANLFRDYCLQNNLLDYSLQMEVFRRFLWPLDLCRNYLKHTYTHLVADNIEEDTPAAHDLLQEWLPGFHSALLIYDQEAGFRRFLGADPDGAYDLVSACDEHHVFQGSLQTSEALTYFSNQVTSVFRPSTEKLDSEGLPQQRKLLIRDVLSASPSNERQADLLKAALDFPGRPLRFYPQMIDWAVERVVELVDSGTPAREIVILAPLMPDSLRFALASRLESHGIPYRSHRPSRSLREEPAAQAVLTLVSLAHPQWGLRPQKFEVALAMIQAIDGLDLVRAQLLTEAVYRVREGRPVLLPFDQVRAATRDRVTYTLGHRYERLRLWIERYRSNEQAGDEEVELDFFMSRLFGEVLSQPGYGFHANTDAGQVCANLIESAQKFRWAVRGKTPAPIDFESLEKPLGMEYVEMIQEGILAAQYIESWQIPPENGVLLAPAYTFLLANQPVDHQFWLDAGNQNWSTRLLQPLTHPQVLTRTWQRSNRRVWTDADENEFARDTLYRLVLGLVRRCRQQIHLGLCEMNEAGYESRGLLLRAIYQVQQQARGGRHE